MKNWLLISVLVLSVSGLMLLGCKGSSTKGSKQKVQADFVVKIEHTGCRGTCPVYWMSVNAKGEAKYYGHHSVEMMGNYTKILPVSAVKELNEAIESANFWKFDAEYGGGVADIPSVVTEVTHGGKNHRVNDIRQAPAELKSLEERIESLIGKDGWQPVKE